MEEEAKQSKSKWNKKNSNRKKGSKNDKSFSEMKLLSCLILYKECGDKRLYETEFETCLTKVLTMTIPLHSSWVYEEADFKYRYSACEYSVAYKMICIQLI